MFGFVSNDLVPWKKLYLKASRLQNLPLSCPLIFYALFTIRLQKSDQETMCSTHG